MKATLPAAELRRLVSEAALHAGKLPPRNAITLEVDEPHRLLVSASDTYRSFPPPAGCILRIGHEIGPVDEQ